MLSARALRTVAIPAAWRSAAAARAAGGLNSQLPFSPPQMLREAVLIMGAALAVGTAWRLSFRRRRRHGSGLQHRRHASRLLPRGRPLPSAPDELSLVSYNILCER